MPFSLGKISRTWERLPTFFPLPTELCSLLLSASSHMPSMFESICKNLVRDFEDKDLRPVRYLLSANKSRQFATLWKKRKNCSQFWEQPDVPVEYTLVDILEPSSSAPGTVVTGPFLFSDTIVQKQAASADLSAGLHLRVSGEASGSHGSSLEFQAVTIPLHNWEDLQKRKVLDQELFFLVECKIRGDNLCFIPWNTLVKGEAVGEGLRVREKTLTLPKGTVMASKRTLLVSKGNGWYISDDDKQRTFPEEQLRMLMSSGEWVTLEPKVGLMPVHKAALHNKSPDWHERLRADFRCLQEEVSEKAEAAARLPRDVQDVVFSNVQDMLRDREALEALVHMLEQEPLGHLNGPGGTILNKLQEDSGYSWSNTKYLILYLLEAIVVLNDTQLDLLARSMEKGILLHQRELVRSILEPNFKYPWNIPFTLKPALLAPLQGEALLITCSLLEECGLEVKLNRPGSTWDLEAKQPLSALYGALSVLQQLAAA
ncbi:Gasdermin-C [Manis pentadactyla]|nr:Gasdermin-C [Manis pentadactyla]